MYLVSGMSLELVCRGTGAPPPNLSWSVDGRSFDAADDRVTMSGETLAISGVNEVDSGTYYCTAMSTAGTVASSVNVIVVGADAILAREVLGTRGQNMQLDCVPGIEQGAKVVWVFEMMLLLDSDKYSITDNGSLIVRGIDLADMGIYVCFLGDIAVNVTLTVQCKYAILVLVLHSEALLYFIAAIPEIILFTEGPCNDRARLSVASDQDDLLVCSAFAIPPPNITLIFRDNTVVS